MRCQRLVLSMLSREPVPPSTTSSHQTSNQISWNTHACFGGGRLVGKKEQLKALEKADLRGADTGPTGVVTCETRDLGIKWPPWHTMLFEGQVTVEKEIGVCPAGPKHMLLKQEKMDQWKRWAAKHECEELKDGAWLQPIQAV